jgi:hypothetical protein
MGLEEYIRYSLLSSRLANYRTAKSQLCLSRERRDKNGTLIAVEGSAVDLLMKDAPANMRLVPAVLESSGSIPSL